MESCIIHLRNLIEFIWNDSPRPDDAVAADYFPTPEAWARSRPAFPEVLLPARSRAGKEIAHLTYARLKVTPKGKQWQFVDMANAMLGAMHQFAQAAPADHVGGLRHASC
jgi:hypothetical protein